MTPIPGNRTRKMLHQRHYTTESANAVIPLVRATVHRLQDAKRLLQDEGFDAGFATLADVAGGAWPGRLRARAAVEATLGFEQLEELDLLVRDLQAGPIGLPPPPPCAAGARSICAGRSTSPRSGSGTPRSPATPAGSRLIPGSKQALSGLSGSLPTIRRRAHPRSRRRTLGSRRT